MNVVDDKTFLTIALPKLQYDTYDLFDGFGCVQWRFDSFAFQLVIDWEHQRVQASFALGGLLFNGSLKPGHWRTVANGVESVHVIHGFGLEKKVLYSDNNVFSFECNLAGRWSEVQGLAQAAAVYVRDNWCVPDVKGWRPVIFNPIFPLPPWRKSDLSFTDMKTMMNGLIKRPVV